MVTAARWVALVVAVMVVAGVTGCGGSSGGPKGTDIALVTPGARDDPDWTQQNVAAVRKVASRLHVRAVIVDGATAGSIRATIERVSQHAQLVVVPYPGDRATAMSVAARTTVPTLVWGDPHALRKKQLADMEFAAATGAYAAGTMAIHASLVRAVGIVLCNDAEPLEMANRYRMASDFVAGALAQSSKAHVFYEHTGDGSSPVTNAQATAATLRLTLKNKRTITASGFTEPGAEFVFADCGKSMAGVMNGVKLSDGEHQMIGITGTKTSVNKENILLTSILVHPEIGIEQALRDIRAGSFGTHVYTMDFVNRGASLLRTGRTPADAWEAGYARTGQLRRQHIALPEATTEEALQQSLGSRLGR
jgi:basic membrane protein A and related proteins